MNKKEIFLKKERVTVWSAYLKDIFFYMEDGMENKFSSKKYNDLIMYYNFIFSDAYLFDCKTNLW